MTIAETKEAIASALTAVPGVTGYASRPRSLKPGDAFVRWGGWERADGAAYETTFHVIIVLPQGSEEAADRFAYESADLLEAALRPLMFVDSFTPTELAAEGQTRGLFALTITGRTE